MEACWVTDGGVKALAKDAIRDVAAKAEGVVWVHIDREDTEGMALLTDLIQVREPDIADCHLRTPVPKLHAYADHYFTAINGLARGTDGRLHFQPLKIFLANRVVFTLFGPCNEVLPYEALRRDLDAIRRRLDAGETIPQTGFQLAADIRLEMLHAQEDLVASGAGRVAQLERNVLRVDPVRTESLLEELFGLRHDLQMIRTNAAQTYELYVYLIDMLGSQETLMRPDPRRLEDLRQGYSHLKNTTDLEREYLQEVLDLFQTRIATELNRFVRKITAWGTIGIAWTVIAGIYGMNFTHMPELNWEFGYPGAIGLMGVVGTSLGVLFRKRGWL